jgi:hypothetical protein
MLLLDRIEPSEILRLLPWSFVFEARLAATSHGRERTSDFKGATSTIGP